MKNWKITEVNGDRYRKEIAEINGLFSEEFVGLKDQHYGPDCFWWLVHDGLQLVGFAGMVPFVPFPRVGYLKRAGVIPAYRGLGIQQALMEARTIRAKASTDWTHFVSECAIDATASANNFIRAGFKLVTPERPWAENTLFWRREI